MLSKKRNNRINLKSRKHKKVSKSRKQNSRSKVSKTRKNILRGGNTTPLVKIIPHYTEPHQNLPAIPHYNNNNPPPVPDRLLKEHVKVTLQTNTHADPQNIYGNEEL
jgi:hypothetical protein